MRDPEHLASGSLLEARKKAEVVRWRRGTRRRDREIISHGVCPPTSLLSLSVKTSSSLSGRVSDCRPGTVIDYRRNLDLADF